MDRFQQPSGGTRRPTQPPARFDWNQVVNNYDRSGTGTSAAAAPSTNINNINTDNARRYDDQFEYQSNNSRDRPMGSMSPSNQVGEYAPRSASTSNVSAAPRQQQYVSKYNFGGNDDDDDDDARSWRSPGAASSSSYAVDNHHQVPSPSSSQQRAMSSSTTLSGLKYASSQQKQQQSYVPNTSASTAPQHSYPPTTNTGGADGRPRSSTLPYVPTTTHMPNMRGGGGGEAPEQQAAATDPPRGPMRPSDMLVPQRISKIEYTNPLHDDNHGRVSGGGGGYRSRSQQAVGGGGNPQHLLPSSRSGSQQPYPHEQQRDGQQQQQQHLPQRRGSSAGRQSESFYSSNSMHLSPPTRQYQQPPPSASPPPATRNPPSPTVTFHNDPRNERRSSSNPQQHQQQHRRDPSVNSGGGVREGSEAGGGGSPRYRNSASPAGTHFLQNGLSRSDFQTNVNGPLASGSMSDIPQQHPSSAASTGHSRTTSIVANGIDPSDLYRRSNNTTTDLNSSAPPPPPPDVNTTAAEVASSSTTVNHYRQGQQQPQHQQGVRAESIVPEGNDSGVLQFQSIPNADDQHSRTVSGGGAGGVDYNLSSNLSFGAVQVQTPSSFVGSGWGDLQHHRSVSAGETTPGSPVLELKSSIAGSRAAASASAAVAGNNSGGAHVRDPSSSMVALPHTGLNLPPLNNYNHLSNNSQPQSALRETNHSAQRSMESAVVHFMPAGSDHHPVGDQQHHLQNNNNSRLHPGMVQSPSRPFPPNQPPSGGNVRVVVEHHKPEPAHSHHSTVASGQDQQRALQLFEEYKRQLDDDHDHFDQRRLGMIKHLETELKRKDAEIMQLRLSLNRHYVTSVSIAGYAQRLKAKSEQNGGGQNHHSTPHRRVQSADDAEGGADANPDREIRIDMSTSGGNQLIGGNGGPKRRNPVIPPHVAGLPLAPIPYSKHPGSSSGKGATFSHMTGFLWIFDTCFNDGGVNNNNDGSSSKSGGLFGLFGSGSKKKNFSKNKRHKEGEWVLVFVVADDRGVSIYTNQDDFKELSYHRCRVHCPYSTCEYFVPRFSSAPDTVISSTDADPKQPKVSRTSSTIDVNAGVGLKPVYNAQADDSAGVHFGFVPLQPIGSSSASAIPLNPPVIFRTSSHQEYQDWSHFFAMSFNRKLYREMFPMLYLSALDGDTVFSVSEGTSTHDLETIMKPIEDLQRDMQTLRDRESENRELAEMNNADDAAQKELEEQERMEENEKMIAELVEEEVSHRAAQIHEDVKADILAAYEDHKRQMAEECSTGCQTDANVEGPAGLVSDIPQDETTGAIGWEGEDGMVYSPVYLGGGNHHAVVQGLVNNNNLQQQQPPELAPFSPTTTLDGSPITQKQLEQQGAGNPPPLHSLGGVTTVVPPSNTTGNTSNPLASSIMSIDKSSIAVADAEGMERLLASSTLKASMKNGSWQLYLATPKSASATPTTKPAPPKNISNVPSSLRLSSSIIGGDDGIDTAAPTPTHQDKASKALSSSSNHIIFTTSSGNQSTTATTAGGGGGDGSAPNLNDHTSAELPHGGDDGEEGDPTSESRLMNQREIELKERTDERNAAMAQSGSLKLLLAQSQSAVKELSCQLHSIEAGVAASSQANSLRKRESLARSSSEQQHDDQLPHEPVVHTGSGSTIRNLVSPARDESGLIGESTTAPTSQPPQTTTPLPSTAADAIVATTDNEDDLKYQITALLEHCNDLEEELKDSKEEQDRLKKKTVSLKDEYGRKVRELCERAALDIQQVTAAANKTLAEAEALRQQQNDHDDGSATDSSSTNSSSTSSDSYRNRHRGGGSVPRHYRNADPTIDEACAISLFVTRGAQGHRADFDLRCDMDAGTMVLQGVNRLDSDDVGGEGGGDEEDPSSQFLFRDGNGAVPRQVRHGWAFKDLLSPTVIVVDLQCFPQGLEGGTGGGTTIRRDQHVSTNTNNERQQLHPLWATDDHRQSSPLPPPRSERSSHALTHSTPSTPRQRLPTGHRNVLYAPTPSFIHQSQSHVNNRSSPTNTNNNNSSGGFHHHHQYDYNTSLPPPATPAPKTALQPSSSILRPVKSSTSSMIDVKRMLLNPPSIPARGNKSALLRKRTGSTERRKSETHEHKLEQYLDHDTTAWHHQQQQQQNSGADTTRNQSVQQSATNLPISGRAFFAEDQQKTHHHDKEARQARVDSLAAAFIQTVKQGFSASSRRADGQLRKHVDSGGAVSLEELARDNEDASIHYNNGNGDDVSDTSDVGVEHYYKLLRDAGHGDINKKATPTTTYRSTSQALNQEDVYGDDGHHVNRLSPSRHRRLSPGIIDVHHYV